jgi:hypothetical protein
LKITTSGWADSAAPQLAALLTKIHIVIARCCFADQTDLAGTAINHFINLAFFYNPVLSFVCNSSR